MLAHPSEGARGSNLLESREMRKLLNNHLTKRQRFLLQDRSRSYLQILRMKEAVPLGGFTDINNTCRDSYNNGSLERSHGCNNSFNNGCIS
jgi:hypothetical protein